ncbi:MAG: TetR/AcrR family transcriptional regulator [Firmicutes bacterium]|nr:TetR/AcrR family transcriptional regulator [Bacillota bacterium]
MFDFEDTDSLIDLLEYEVRPMSKSERTRLKIMASAAKVFNEKGFAEASIKDIADDAGIAKGTIYYYIEKKEDLFLMLVNFGQARLFAKVEKGLKKATTASEKIETIIRAHLKMLKILGPVMPAFAQNLLTVNSKTREAIAGFRERYVNYIASAIEEGIASGEFRQVDSKKTAVAIIGMVLGQLLQYRLFTGVFNVKEIGDTTMDMVIKGLRKTHEE